MVTCTTKLIKPVDIPQVDAGICMSEISKELHQKMLKIEYENKSCKENCLLNTLCFGTMNS
jgi:hypothetical protein